MAQAAPDGRAVFTAPRFLWWLSLLTLGLLAFLIVLVISIGIGFFMTGHALAGLFFAGLGAFLAVVLRQVARNTRGLGQWHITLEDENLRLSLPAARSLSRKLDPVSRILPLAEIDSVETRLETYRSLGMANINRGYALRLKDGSSLLLGEDRAQGTSMASRFVADAAQALLDRGIEMHDLGMSEGRGGLLGVAFVRPADWDAPAVEEARAEMLTRRARRTGMVAWVAALVVLVVVALQNLI